MIFDILFVLGYFIILFYIASLKKNSDDILAGRSQGLFSVLFSLLATETSAASLLVFPNLGYDPNFRFNLISMLIGFFIGRIFIAHFLIEPMYKSQVYSVYELIQKKAGNLSYRAFSIFYLIATPLAAGVRLFIAALGIFSLYTTFNTNIESFYSLSIIILITGSVAIIYSMHGGLSGIIKTDILQFFLIIIGSVSLLVYIGQKSNPNFLLSINDFIRINTRSGFFTNLENYYFPLSFLGGFFVVLGSHSIDQTNLQRILASSGIKTAKRAMALSGFFIIPMILFFLFIGWIIHAYDAGIPSTEKVFPSLIYKNKNSWGIIFRPLFLIVFLSAALSSIDSTLHAMGTVTYRLFDSTSKYFRIFAFFSGIILIIFAILFLGIHLSSPKSPLISLALGITGMFFTPMASILTYLLLNKSNHTIYDKRIILSIFPGILINILIFIWNFLFLPFYNHSLPGISWILGNIISFLYPMISLIILNPKSKNAYIEESSIPEKKHLKKFKYLKKILNHGDHDNIEITPLKEEVSMRRFYRIASIKGQSLFPREAPNAETYVLCVYLDKTKANARTNREIKKYMNSSHLLKKLELSSSKVLERKNNHLLITDAGNSDLYDIIQESHTKNEKFNPSNQKIENLYFQSIDWLIKLHKKSNHKIAKKIKTQFTPKIYYNELMFFLDQFLKISDRDFDFSDLKEIKEFFQKISVTINDPSNHVLNHRDFHSRNIMVSLKGTVTIIDYQDIRWGNPWYDLISLLYDPYVNLPKVFREKLLLHFLKKSGYSLDRDSLKTYEYTILQRLIKAIGTYLYQIIHNNREDYRIPLQNAQKSIELLKHEIDYPEVMEKVLKYLPST